MSLSIATGDLVLGLSEEGSVVSWSSKTDHAEYVPTTGASSPFIRLAAQGELHAPASVTYCPEDNQLSFLFAAADVKVDLQVTLHERYTVFEIVQIHNEAAVELILWGPYTTKLNGSIGESVGVVHDGQFAIGLQVLNMKTVGGWPLEWNRLDCVQPSNVPDNSKPNGDEAAIAVSGDGLFDSRFDYTVCTAWPTSEGSLLQAYARNRELTARRPVWNLPEVEVIPISGEDARIVGTKIALFGCPLAQVLDTIERIELGEGLPHPTFDGVWGKVSNEATRSYLITDFSEASMAEALRYTELAGFNYVYHPDPFAQWGHFTLKERSFPSGDEGLRICVELAESQGIHVGLHTLSNFTTLNDNYVTPVPDDRLQLVGRARTAEPIGADAEQIEIDHPEPFRAALFRHTARIGNELLEYERVSDEAPWMLLGVSRGVNGTTAEPHPAGAEIGRLWDHAYDVFFPNIELQDAYSARLSTLFAATGLKQISFDGLEGLYATGQEDYGVNRFVQRCYYNWGDEVINDASIVVPNYLWHICTRFNWGEPWGAATREGQLEWRLSNQRFFARNFIPPMLGWFLIRSTSERFEATTQDEIEWVLSKAAGFGAGFALVADLDVLGRNGNSEMLLKTVREWETARQSGAFTPEQRERLRKPEGDWHLEQVNDNEWKLYPLNRSKPLLCSPAELQPGQPGGSDWAIYNPYSEQPLSFCMRVSSSYRNSNASVKRPTFYTNGVYMTFDVEIMADQYLVCSGERTGEIFDLNWNLLKTVLASADAPTVRHGGQTLSFSCKFTGDPKPEVHVTVFTRGEPEGVSASNNQRL